MAKSEKSGSDGVGNPALPSTVVQTVVPIPQPGPEQIPNKGQKGQEKASSRGMKY